ncbi:hypothetical protein [Aureimonas endophytica]|uniref:hypothetical protein n=1 Tax=Aureimonas endophytica TaxID=2027858 RepID=UPI0016671097|nr:hypothetical protein [Aureimonas endophytica]
MAFAASAGSVTAEPAVNACPVDGCQIHFVSVEKADGELRLTLEANFKPDMSKNHIHVWWGDNFDVKQVSNNAETLYGVKRGVWHPTDEYPVYVTQSGASMKERRNATTLCVSAGDRNHDIIDPALFECRSVADLVK